MSLVETFPPNEDESGFGYYRRLAAGNALWGWRELASLANVASSKSALLTTPEHVAKELGLEPAWSKFASEQDQLSRGWRGLQRSRSDAVCAACLTNEPYLRHYWQHVYLTTCPIHRLRLLDRCQACAEPLSQNRERIEQCVCGHDLRTLTSIAASPTQHWLSTLIASDGAYSGGCLPKLHHVNSGALCELVRLLCLYAEPSSPPPRRNAAPPKSISEAVELLAPLESLLDDWPFGFERHVAERMASGNRQARTLNTLLGQWYVHMRKTCQGNGLEVFLEVVIQVAAHNFDGVLGLDGTKDLVTGTTEHVRMAEAAKSIGISRDRLHKAMEEGNCLARKRRMGTRGVVYEVSLQEVERIQQRRLEWVGDAQACELAGVPPAVLRNMVAAKVVAADSRWRNSILKGGPLNRQSLTDFINRVSQLAPHKAPIDKELVSFAELTSRRMGDKQAIQSLMKAIADGDVVAAVRGRYLGQLGFLRSDVAPYFGTPLLEAGMSVQQLAKFTGWKWESISHWLSLGLLESQQIVLRGQPCRVVSPQQLLSFRQSFVPLADLAKAMGTKSSSLTGQLSSLEVVGAKVSPEGIRRGGLIRMADLGRFAVAGQQVQRAASVEGPL